ncbi:MAG TPA: hypothetical protein VKR58_06245 [Aquella sp.]|nr:hypothetical protein [Aquella sp.]
MTAPNGYKLAKEKYLSYSLQDDIPPSFSNLADEFGIDEQILAKHALEDGWLQLRRIRQQEFQKQLLKFDSRNLSKQAKDLSTIRINLFNNEIELVQTQFAKLVKYIDDMIDNGDLGPKEALSYLKMIMEKSSEIQNIIDRKHASIKEEGAVDFSSLLQEMGTKQKLIEILKDEDDPYKNERELIFAQEE